MNEEIERKFLVISDGWRAGAAPGALYRQGYLTTGTTVTVRVRVAGDRGYLTLKGLHAGLSRAEFEYKIPLADAQQMLTHLCSAPPVEKVRYRVEHAGLIWEVDEFTGTNAPLVLAEVELENETQPVTLPDWVGQEVSTDVHYTNAYLAQRPYSTWRSNPDG